MTNRITSTLVTFIRPFLLGGFETVQAAGTYAIDVEEEQNEAPFPGWRRVSTVMQIARHGITENVPIDPNQLSEALIRDGAQHGAAMPSSAMPPARHKQARLAARALQRLGGKSYVRRTMMDDAAFKLSRVYAQGWNVGRTLSAGDFDAKTVAAINPYPPGTEHARWQDGFSSGLGKRRT